MAEETGISWADATLNFWIGCTKVSPACDNCYAETWGNRFGVKWGAREERRRCVKNRTKAHKLQKLAVTRKVRNGQPFFCFSNSLSDIFDNAVPIEWLKEAFDDMRASPDVTYLLLTKRPGNIFKRAEEAGGLPPNAALGITVVNQEEFNRDVPVLAFAAQMLRPAFTFLSVEPMLGGITTTALLIKKLATGALMHALHFIDWIIVGGESGAKARPIHPDWVRSLRDQCAAAGVPFHWKQWGEWRPGIPVSSGVKGWFALHWPGSGWQFFDQSPRQMNRFGSDATMTRVGTEGAGNHLDGVQHLARPIPRAA